MWTIMFVGVIGIVSAQATSLIPANDPNIQYFGRWNFANPTAPTQSWPGVYIVAKFEGTSVGIVTNDNNSYYNVTIDDSIHSIFHGSSTAVASYTLRSGLPDGTHIILVRKRNETYGGNYSFNGFVLDDGKSLLPPPPKPVRKIEFIGDSFTGASGDEWTGTDTAPDAAFYTNIDKGFPAIIAANYGAQFQVTSRSGYGLVQTFQADPSGNLPDIYNRTLVYSSSPAWNFDNYIPNLVVICLGLNDYSGWTNYVPGVVVSPANTDLFKTRYHDYIAWIRSVYPGTKVLAVAAHPDWIVATVGAVVNEEKAAGHKDVFFAWFPWYGSSAYVNGGHPSAATHLLIADTLMAVIDTIDAWHVNIDSLPPAFVHVPPMPVTVATSSYTLAVQTNEYATVKYSTEDKSFDLMEYQLATKGGLEHSATLTGVNGQSYTYYLRGKDLAGNTMDTSLAMQFTVDTTKSTIAWYSPAYDDSHWKVGYGPLGVGSLSTNNTLLSRVTTAYFRKNINIADVSSTGGLTITLAAADGAIAYVNGHLIGRNNMATSGVVYDTYALGTKSISPMFSMTRGNGLLAFWQNGDNVVAIEVHAANGVSRLTFDGSVRDSSGYAYVPTFSPWSYFDGGVTPPAQVIATVNGIADGAASVPARFALKQNYPNPFNPVTTIRYELSKSGRVKLSVFDLLGRETAVLVDGIMPAGSHTALFAGRNLASGVYFYRLDAEGKVAVRKMMLMK